MTLDIKGTLDDRGSVYGNFTDNARITQDLYEVIMQAPHYHQLTYMHREAYHMIFHKIARSVCGDCMHIDNIHDLIGYAQLLEDFLITKNVQR